MAAFWSVSAMVRAPEEDPCLLPLQMGHRFILAGPTSQGLLESKGQMSSKGMGPAQSDLTLSRCQLFKLEWSSES